jgi:lipopolysaccharide/colanic/teichoic acid biosynthesis glycosyltransferase
MTYHFVKRLIDILLAIVLGIFSFPICLITALAIKLDSQGPVMADTPPRVGQGGKPFKLYKFRSMIVGAHDLLRKDPRFKKLYEEYKRSSFKLHNDPRWTRVGQFIRKYSIDEFPQFINVLRGEMSIVGPRPYYPDELEEQQKKYPQTIELVKEVLSVKPGITGEWQVSGRSEINFDKRIAMDANYARKKSLWYDIVILFKTPWAMITGSGAV